MKITTKISIEIYKCYSECTIEEWILQSFKDAPNNTLSLPDIGKIKVNWNKLIWSYSKAIMTLRKKWYAIKTTIYHDSYKKVTRVIYKLENPTYSWSIND